MLKIGGAPSSSFMLGHVLAQLGHSRRASSTTKKLVELPGLPFAISMHGLMALNSIVLSLDLPNAKKPMLGLQGSSTQSGLQLGRDKCVA
jgi:hypothetical protein